MTSDGSPRCRACAEPLSIGALVVGCHACGTSQLPLEPLADLPPGEAPLCRLCLAPAPDPHAFLVDGCAACGVGLALRARVEPEGTDALGLPLLDPEALPPSAQRDYAGYVAARELLVAAQRRLLTAGDRAAALADVTATWRQVQVVLHRSYAAAEARLRLERLASQAGPGEEIAALAHLLFADRPGPV